MTGQTILDYMEVLFPEMQLQTGEADVVKGLLAANMSQDLFESIAATYPKLYGDSQGTVATANGTETTAYPSTLMRLDGMDFIDPVTNRPSYPLDPIEFRGGHAFYLSYPTWLYSYVSSNLNGRPRGYWTNGRTIGWAPTPDGVYTIRYYGFVSQVDITAVGTFLYPDQVALPIATLAVKIIRAGLDDDVSQLKNLADETFLPLMKNLEGFRREGPHSMVYRFHHDT